ncbi:MAG: UbiD family decarboxylase [Zavarzinella sp.]
MMIHRTLHDCVRDLEKAGMVRRIDHEIDPHLEMAEIQRRTYQAQGPALLFTRPKGCRFPMVGNIFGTPERTRYLFRHTLRTVQTLIRVKMDPPAALKRFWQLWRLPGAALSMLPKRVRRGSVFANETTISQLPKLVSWPDDGGPFVTLPLVFSHHPDQPGWRRSNLGMYRVQLAGNDYLQDQEVGLHYQLHRGIGIHHQRAMERGEPLPVNILVGGPPSLILSAVMPLPDDLPELLFAGALGGRRVRLAAPQIDGRTWPVVPSDVDFCICGEIYPGETKPEGPFGDHLGYYAKVHDFPVLRVRKVFHRTNAIWPFTVVGRPPQEDTSFGEIIHEITGPLIPTVLPGVHEVHAVDAAGVHPLLLAIGSERYVPYSGKRKPRELLTCANAILGQGQLSLAKYLLIAAHQDDPKLTTHHIDEFLVHLLQRVDWQRDLHFQTRTTMDTLDYSGSGLNEGSKVVIAGAGPVRRQLGTDPTPFRELFASVGPVASTIPGVLLVQGSRFFDRSDTLTRLQQVLHHQSDFAEKFPLLVVVDDLAFAAASLNNFLWVTFTRSDPAQDIYGIDEFIEQKHWGCRGSLVIDARIKPHHAPPLVEDPAVTKRVDELAARGGPLAGLF